MGGSTHINNPCGCIGVYPAVVPVTPAISKVIIGIGPFIRYDLPCSIRHHHVFSAALPQESVAFIMASPHSPDKVTMPFESIEPLSIDHA